MQYVIVAIVILAAAALVLVPLVRAPRGAGAGDLDEPAPPRREEQEVMSQSDDAAPAGGVQPGGDVGVSRTETAGFPPERVAAPPPAAPRTTPDRTAPPASAPQPPGEAGAEELPQSAPPPAGPARPLSAGDVAARARRGEGAADAATEEEILRYREALRARTICGYCSTANPPGSKFCKECGEQLDAVQAARD